MWCQRVHHVVPASGNGRSVGSETPWLIKLVRSEELIMEDRSRHEAAVDTSAFGLVRTPSLRPPGIGCECHSAEYVL